MPIAVEDDGPGIAADYAADVVNRGTRLDSQTTGQGIGLSLVSDLLSIYGGELLDRVQPIGRREGKLGFLSGPDT